MSYNRVSDEMCNKFLEYATDSSNNQSKRTIMNSKLNFAKRILITSVMSLAIWGQVIWDYFHGEIPTHYLLHNPNLPGIPNWVGAILFPFFVYFLLYRIHKRIDEDNSEEPLQKILWRFLGGLIFAVSISVCFVNGIEYTDYILALVFLLAFIYPLYKSEYYLGWVLGAAFTFGAFIPILFGGIFCILFFLIFRFVRFVKGILKPKSI